MEKDMDKVLCFIIMNESTKENGNVIISTVKDIRSFKMLVLIKVIMSMENLKELEGILGLMENFMKENGSMDSSMAQVCGREQRVTVM
jgi:microsomal dipeptidase-like Zn-dependent dipeptidase